MPAKKNKRTTRPKTQKNKAVVYLLGAAIVVNAITVVTSPSPLWPLIALALTAAALVYTHKGK